MTRDLTASQTLCLDSSGGTPRLLEIMARLRDPENGCPWDIEQDFTSIAPYTIEEAYEVADAIARNDMDELKAELGDLLLQVVYHSQMASEAKVFDFSDVVTSISDKMIHRHPHVFGDERGPKTAKQQTTDWETIKAAERQGKDSKPESALNGVAIGLPALIRAVKLQNRAARVGFDWPATDQVIDKIHEEAAELEEARDSQPHARQVEEFGDLMFVIANLARHLEIDPESALRDANDKFTRRFQGVEARLHKMGKTPEQSNLAEMDRLWDAEKQAE